MKPYAKRDDIKMANLQDTIMKGLSGMSNCINELLQCWETKTIPNYRNIMPQLLKTTALLGHVCRELSFKRKEPFSLFFIQILSHYAQKPQIWTTIVWGGSR